MDNLKIKESLRYISLNKVRIASFKDKLNKNIIKDYLSLINMKISFTVDDMKIGFTVEDMIRMEENRINKVNTDNCYE